MKKESNIIKIAVMMNSSVEVQMVELFREGRGSEGTESTHSEEVLVLEESENSGIDESVFYGAVEGIISQFEKKAEKDKVQYSE